MNSQSRNSLELESAAVNAGHRGCAPDHHVHFYEDENEHLALVASFLAAARPAGTTGIAIVTSAHRAELVRLLEAAGVRFPVDGRSDVLLLDAEELLDTFVINGVLELDRLSAQVTELMGGLREPYVWGEMVEVLCNRGQGASVLPLEALWNELALRYRFKLFCGYSLKSFARESDGQTFLDLCGHHARVIPAGLGQSVLSDARARELAVLQQRSRALDSEIAQRRILEQALRDALDDRTRAQESAERSEAELHTFLENAAQGLHWIGPDGVILWANRAELQMLGYSREEYVGHHFGEFHVDQALIANMLAGVAAGEVPVAVEARMRCKDGSVRDVLIDSNGLWRNGVFVRAQCFTRDITERRRTEDALRQAGEEARQARHAQSEFLASVSHELRTPLNGIIGYQELLDYEVGGPLTTRQREYLGRIKMSAEQLLKLIDQVHTLSRLDSSRETLNFKTVEVCSLVRETAAGVEPLISRKQLAFRMRTPAQPEIFHTDPAKLKQILLNLLSNAAKFTADGTIELEVQVQPDQLQVVVRDTGAGIPEADFERIFEPFVEKSGPRRALGVGLGLPISRKLARLLGGALTVQSKLGSGSEFTLTLPRQRPAGANLRT